MVTRFLLTTACLVSASAGAFAADVHRCTGSDGSVAFSDAPCRSAQRAEVVRARPNSVDNSAVREQLLKIENQKLRDEMAATRRAPVAGAEGGGVPARADSADCRAAKRDVEVAASSIDKNQALVRARTSAMHIACGVREPDRQETTVNVGVGVDRARGDGVRATPV